MNISSFDFHFLQERKIPWVFTAQNGASPKDQQCLFSGFYRHCWWDAVSAKITIYNLQPTAEYSEYEQQI